MQRKVFIYSVLILIFVNLLAHFLPFERAALSPDDYHFLDVIKNLSFSEMITKAFSSADRPLNYVICFLFEKMTGFNTTVGLICIFLSSTLLAVSIFFLLYHLSLSTSFSLLCSVFYLLLPNKLDLYHTKIYGNLNAAYTLVILSFLMFLYFIKKNKKLFLVLSVVCYSWMLFWYEVGAFLPLILLIYLLMYEDRKKYRIIFFYGIPMIVYAAYRLTGGFGLATFDEHIDYLNPQKILYNIFTMAPHHYVGRYMIRSILYGTYKFLSVDPLWLGIMVLLDLGAIYYFIKWIRHTDFPSKIDIKFLFFAFVIWFCFLIPNFMFIIESRHTALASIGFSLLSMSLLLYWPKFRIQLITMVFVICLIACQGTAWNQVVICRVNHAIFDHIKQHKEEIDSADTIVFNQYSFAKSIPYTLGDRSKNMLDYYWGMEGVRRWGIASMIQSVADHTKSIYVSRSEIQNMGDKLIFSHLNSKQKIVTVSKNKTVVIDYNSVYHNGFKNGHPLPTESTKEKK